MLDRNKFMVDHANLLFAVYAGISRSGTASTVAYAQNQGREILILDPLTYHFRHFLSQGDPFPENVPVHTGSQPDKPAEIIGEVALIGETGS